MADETQTETVNAEGEFVAEPTAPEAPVEAAPVVAEEPNYATNPPTHTLDPLTGAWVEIDYTEGVTA